jgi:hypothetical protein
MLLETNDGAALLGYAGLGITAGGKEPSDWMSAALRGRGLPLERSLGVLAKAIEARLPPHLRRLAARTHQVVVPAIVGTGTRLYTIGLAVSRGEGEHRVTFARQMRKPGVDVAVPFGVAGSGAGWVRRNKTRMRDLLRLVRAAERRRVSPPSVADHFARLNHDVATIDRTVGPRCIVAWRFSRHGGRGGGGGHHFYTGTSRERAVPALPESLLHWDGRAMAEIFFAKLLETRRDPLSFDWGSVIDAWGRLPEKPDDRLD